MVRSHTYFLARRPKGSCTFGALKDNSVVATQLEWLYFENKGNAEPTVVDGVSVWIDEAGVVQARVIAGGVSRPIEPLGQLVALMVAASETP